MGAPACRLRRSRGDRVLDGRARGGRTNSTGRRGHPAAVPGAVRPPRPGAAAGRPSPGAVRPVPRPGPLPGAPLLRPSARAPGPVAGVPVAARLPVTVFSGPSATGVVRDVPPPWPRGVPVPGRRGSPAGRGRVGVCWAVLVMTLCIGVPVGSARDVPGSNFWLGILYGAPGRGGKDVAERVGGAGTFAYPGDLRAREPITAGVPRVNFGREVDGSEGVGGDSIGDTRTYPEGPPGGAAPPAERSSPRHSDYESGQPCASTSPDPPRSRRGVQDG